MLSLASSPVSSPGGVLVLAVLGSRAYSSETNPVDSSRSDGFMTRWCSTPSAPEATQAKPGSIDTGNRLHTSEPTLRLQDDGGTGISRLVASNQLLTVFPCSTHPVHFR
jgi:hypothetical protein